MSFHEVTELMAENGALREALRAIDRVAVQKKAGALVAMQRIARSALAEKREREK